MSAILKEKTPGVAVLAYGYEAVARGALEADVKVVAGFPGTPSSGCLEALTTVAKDENIHVEWATNERVALEVAWGAAMDGQRSLCTMNHLGMNVVMDCLKYSNNYGVTGGMVVFAGDDVGANTSAIESDSRVLATAADVPVLCPSTAQEAKEMTKYAFELSEELGCPVVVRSVCQLMMAQTVVSVDARETVPHKSEFAPNPRRVVMFEPGTMSAVTIHRFIHKNLEKCRAILTQKDYDYAEDGEGRIGLVCCGVSYSLTQAGMLRSGISAPVLKLSCVNPMNEDLIVSFAQKVDALLIIEEGEAFVEERIMALLERRGLSTKICGRISKDIPYGGELFTGDIERLLRKVLRGEDYDPTAGSAQPFLSERNLTLCGGCGHMGVFYAIRKTMDTYNGGKYIAFADAGCSFMGILTPAKSITSATNMGGCISFASGAADAGSEVPVLALCGDGGFLHGGFSGLVNAVFNKSNLVILLLDNSTLGNTGLQPTGCTGRNTVGDAVPKVNLEELCRSVGVPYVDSVDPLQLSDTMDAIRKALDAPKPAVIVTRQPCVISRLKAEQKAGLPRRTAVVDAAKCRRCGTCGDLFCSAVVRSQVDQTTIRSDLCSACGMCVELCENGAISLVEVGK